MTAEFMELNIIGWLKAARTCKFWVLCTQIISHIKNRQTMMVQSVRQERQLLYFFLHNMQLLVKRANHYWATEVNEQQHSPQL